MSDVQLGQAAKMSPARALPGSEVSASNVPLLVLFLLCIVLPIGFSVGTFHMTPVRTYVLLAFIPCLLMVLSGKAGRFTPTDTFMLLHGFWVFVALLTVEGLAQLQFAGITAVEIVGGYLIGRVLVRDEAGYRAVFMTLFVIIAALLPFALIELFTGKLVIPDLLRPIFDTPYRGNSAYGRMGLERTYVVFEHPILWGIFCSLTLANFVMLVKPGPGMATAAIVFALGSTFMALSSAPLLACMLQLCLLSWGWIMKGRWKLLAICLVGGYVFVDVLSDRTPIRILISSLTFNPMSGYVRIAIFDAGWAAVKGSPLVGIGFNDWPRPSWVTRSVDNFWLLTSMRYGMVGAGFLIGAWISHIWLVSQAKLRKIHTRRLRIGHVTVLLALAFTMVTVHLWGAIAVLVMFYIGAGSWMYTSPEEETDAGPVKVDAPQPTGPQSRYTRFPVSGAAAPATHRRSIRREPGQARRKQKGA